MTETLRLESEIVLIAPELYLGPEVKNGPALAALARMARFGALERLPHGWRAWLAAWLGRPDLASASPAAVAAVTGAIDVRRAEHVWLADPVHLIAGMSSVHLAPRGVLALDPAAQAELSGTFGRMFAEPGFRLAPVRGGRFLACGPAPAGEVATTEPARWLGASVADAMPRGPGAAALLKLGAEIEMWLHEHPLNTRRIGAGLPPVSTLWLWGGGPPLDADSAADSDSAAGSAAHPGAASDAGSPAAAVFSDDAYVEGLAHLTGIRLAPAARGLAPIVADRAPRRIATVGPVGSPAESLEAFDRDWVGPALAHLARRDLSRLTVIASDRRLSLRPRDPLRLWRRRRSAWEALR